MGRNYEQKYIAIIFKLLGECISDINEFLKLKI